MRERFSGLSFWEIPEDKIAFATDEITLTAAAVFGCEVPDSVLLGEYLAKEITHVIRDFDYDVMTVAEICLALRLNSFPKLKNPLGEDLLQISYPKNFCSAFLNAVLINYWILRNNLDKMIEREITKISY